MACPQDEYELVDKADLKLDPRCELFLGDPDHKTMSTLNQLWLPMASTFIGLGGSFFHNWVNKRPLRASTPRHVVYTVIGLGFGIWAQDLRDRWTGENDLMIYEYMKLHPEDFQAPERVRYRDYLTRWIPTR